MGLSETQLKFFADYIQKQLGIVYAPQSYFQLEKRLEDISKILQVPSADDLYKQALGGIAGNFKQVLLDVATNNETSFFRDPNVFKAIEELIFPEIEKMSPKPDHYRIWSCASSFGQEPYSLAMLAHEYALKHPQGPKMEICSTDISDQALNRAKAGVYSQLEVQRGLGSQRLVKYFAKDQENNWTLSSEVRQRVKFSKLNLLDSFFSMGQFQLILCRHVLIYQTDEKKRDIIERLSACLKPKGYLILGGTESMIGLSTRFDQVAHGGAIVYRKKD